MSDEIDIQTATIQQLMDYCALANGWRRVPDEESRGHEFKKWHKWGEGYEFHPFEAGLDGAAAAMPKPWKVHFLTDTHWRIVRTEPYPGQPYPLGLAMSRTDDERADRWRLAAMAIQADRKNMEHA